MKTVLQAYLIFFHMVTHILYLPNSARRYSNNAKILFHASTKNNAIKRTKIKRNYPFLQSWNLARSKFSRNLGLRFILLYRVKSRIATTVLSTVDYRIEWQFRVSPKHYPGRIYHVRAAVRVFAPRQTRRPRHVNSASQNQQFWIRKSSANLGPRKPYYVKDRFLQVDFSLQYVNRIQRKKGRKQFFDLHIDDGNYSRIRFPLV